MIERAAGNQDDSFMFHSLSMMENIAETYLKEARGQGTGVSREVLDKTSTQLSKTLEQAKHMMGMIEHFRSLEDSSREAQFSQSKGGSLYDSVYQVLRAMQYEFPLEKITILKILPRDLAPPAIPRGYLEAILFQLLYNAREAVGDVSGIVTIEAAEKYFLSSENKMPTRFMLRVSDTGPGIPKEYLEHIYDPFYTIQNPCRINGLGLCLVKCMVEHYRGLLRIETSLMGTSYFIEFSG